MARFVLLLCAVAAVAVMVHAQFLVGGWTNVADVNDATFQDAISFGVTKWAEVTNQECKLVKIVCGASQVVAGVNYRAKCSVDCGAGPTTRCLQVYVRPWEKKLELTGYKDEEQATLCPC